MTMKGWSCVLLFCHYTNSQGGRKAHCHNASYWFRESNAYQLMEEAEIFRSAPIFKESTSFSSHKLQYPKNENERE
ncbi:hypothetical protein HPG69_003480 [Diceros bicornis minor]|uniref:Secreted protein n=1 Tax=Diceros bicornis minor TaxID=77932 RepID=A0A7J7E9A9_DICBM|nr:hypothetical protein HPG69_003480 [Diceros bicornis minor]